MKAPKLNYCLIVIVLMLSKLFAADITQEYNPIFTITSSVQSSVIRSDSVKAVSLFTVTNNTHHSIPNITVDPAYNSRLRIIRLSTDTCSGVTLNPGAHCTFQVIVDGRTLTQDAHITPRVCGFNNAICSKPTGPSVIVHPVIVTVPHVFLGVQPDGNNSPTTNPNGYLQPIIASTNQLLLQVPNFSFGPGNAIGYSQGITVSPDGNTVYIANGYANGTSGGNVQVYDVNSNSIIATIDNTFSPDIFSTFLPIGLALSPDGKTLYMVDDGQWAVNTNSTLYVMDVTMPSSPHYVSSINLGSGFQPGGVLVDPDNSTVYVSNVNQADIAAINSSNYSLSYISTNPGIVTFDLALSHDGSKLYLSSGQTGGASSSDEIQVVDLATNVVNTIPLPNAGPHGIVLNSTDDILYVAGFYDNTIYAITNLNSSTPTISSISTSPAVNPGGIALTPDNTKLYISFNGVSPNYYGILDTATQNLTLYATNGLQNTFGNFIG